MSWYRLERMVPPGAPVLAPPRELVLAPPGAQQLFPFNSYQQVHLPYSVSGDDAAIVNNYQGAFNSCGVNVHSVHRCAATR